ncbi:hypothetical protein VV01_06265 [Luteipulveratus halotolerans]|uniref:LysM domain-containing protein n=1 Tax=Luteipulveratus halotolerans TaxID=1631356 RepID=A0A0L6CNL7_9MICO|nr:hypothetical protein VV01_06265 [Luteipulveratus halotolerans]
MRHLRVVPDLLTRAGQPRLRLTARGRLVLALAGVIAALGVIMASAAIAAGPTPSTSTVTVAEGQTLSEIAHARLPELPVGEAVVRFQLANGLSSLEVNAGQTLVVPSGS